MEKETKKAVSALIEKASQADKSEDAMRFSQAACNCANAFVNLAINDRNEEDFRE